MKSRGKMRGMNSDLPEAWLPRRLNTGPWLTSYTLADLHERIKTEWMVLPICRMGTPVQELEKLAPLILPPLFHEAMDEPLKSQLLARIHFSFPYVQGSAKRESFRGKLEVVELPRDATVPEPPRGRLVAFSADTAVEEHGPHLPLATDRIQSYAVLAELTRQVEGVVLAPPLDYGHLIWGLAAGLSIDITAPLVAKYLCNYVEALRRWTKIDAVYVVDVHGSPAHRAALHEGLDATSTPRRTMRWLYEALSEFTWSRGDAHAGGVETAMMLHIARELVDPTWWPGRIEQIAREQMPLARALEMGPDLTRWITHAQETHWNGVVGEIENVFNLNPPNMFSSVLRVAVTDAQRLLNS